jgi:glycosyltransferase involved in cell wall biosynthesis
MSEKLTIVLPAHNEAGNIESVVASLLAIRDKIGYDLAIVIVNDGSSDGTGHICQKLSDKHPSIRCITHSRNIGYGGAVISGLRASEGDFVAITDADGQFDVSDLIRLLVYIKSFDVVVGYRMHRADPLGRRMLGSVWSMIGRWCFKIPIRDLNCGLKVFRRSIIEGLPLRCLGPGINLEIMTQIVMAGIPIREVPCSHLPRTSGRQSGGSLRVIARALPEFAHVWRLSRKKAS